MPETADEAARPPRFAYEDPVALAYAARLIRPALARKRQRETAATTGVDREPEHLHSRLADE